MGDQHIEKLESALVQNGWSILRRERQIDWYYAGAWTIQRSTRVGPFHLRFVAVDGLGSTKVRDLPSAWCCRLVEAESVSVYFYRLARFAAPLRAFVTALDDFERNAVRTANRSQQ